MSIKRGTMRKRMRQYKVLGLVEVVIAAESPELAKQNAQRVYGMDVRGQPEELPERQSFFTVQARLYGGKGF